MKLNFKEPKIYWQNDVIIIEKFKQIIDASETKIILKEFCINGEDLKIVSMDKYSIVIKGKIKEILKNEYI